MSWIGKGRVSGHLIGPHTLLHIKEVVFLGQDTHFHVFVAPKRGGIFWTSHTFSCIIWGFTSSLARLVPLVIKFCLTLCDLKEVAFFRAETLIFSYNFWIV